MRWMMTAAIAVAMLGSAGAEARRGVVTDIGIENFPSSGWFTPRTPDELDLTGDGVVAFNLGFAVNFGQGLVSEVFISENGLVYLGGAEPSGGFTNGSLASLGRPVVSPGYGDLFSVAGDNDGFPGFGEILFETGIADEEVGPIILDGFPTIGYDFDQAVEAVRVTWLFTGLGADDGPSVSGQALFYNRGGGDFDLELLSDNNDGTIAGFALGAFGFESAAPFNASTPGLWRFRDGRLVGGGGGVPVPAPATLALFGLGAAAALGARRRGARAA